MRTNRHTRIFILFTAIVLSVALSSCVTVHGQNSRPVETVANVIVMVPDGCSASIQTLARWYKGAPLNLDRLAAGSIRTHMASSVITDSAAAATAFATGHKTSSGFLGVGPRGNDLLTGFSPTAAPYAPVATVLEGAGLRGKATGLVATSRISHATPAAFAAHVHSRDNDNGIMEQMVYQDIDVVFGGGARHLLPAGQSFTTTFGDHWKGKRTDGENLMKVLADRGYTFVDNRDDMLALSQGPVWGLFDDSHLEADIDRDDFHPTQPSLPEMTQKAIELLSKDDRGFFLMVEGSQVDWAGHTNDPVYMVTEFLAFDAAVGKALDFAGQDGKTLVLIFPDHNTGGLSIGHQQSGFPPDYTQTTLEDLLGPIRNATLTVQGVIAKYPAKPTTADIKNAFRRYWGLALTDRQARDIRALGTDSSKVAAYLSKQTTVFGWTTHGHCGEDVPLWSYGPNRPFGNLDNTDLAKIAARALSVDLAEATRRLFVDLDDVVPGHLLDRNDPQNPVVRINNNVLLPLGKDIIIREGIEYRLNGVVVHAPKTGKVYVPRQAADCIRQGWCQ